MKQVFQKLFFVLLCTVATPRAAVCQNAREVAKKSFPSVVIILMEDRSGQATSLGSGFLVEDGVVASNFHVIEGANRGVVKLIGDTAKHEIRGILAADEKNDLVLLEVSGLKAPVLALESSESLAVGDEVYAVGNPRGLEGTFSQGIISSMRKLTNGSLLQITAPISPGSSGGPILNSKGAVIGVAVATFKQGQNLNFAIPVSALRNLLARKREAQPLANQKKLTPRNTVLDEIGPPSTEGLVARKSEWSSPMCFKFSALNQLDRPIKDADFLVVFYDDDDTPIDFKRFTMNKPIPPGLALWISEIDVDRSTARYCSPAYRDLMGRFEEEKLPKPGRLEIRILGFDLVE